MAQVSINDLINFNPLYSNPVDFGNHIFNQSPPTAVENVQPGITVTANRQVPNVDVEGPDAPFMGNRQYLEEAATSMDEAPDRKGMFGVKGTLRDILGTLGDAFLVGSGRDAVYRPGREQEKAADAMTGFTNSPEAAMAAAERLASIGQTDKAQKLLEYVRSQELRSAQLESLQANRESQIADRASGNYTDAMNRIGRLFGTEQAKRNPQGAMAMAARIASAYGTTLEALGISEDITPDEMGMISGSDMTVNQQRNYPLAQRRVEQADERIAIQRQNANRPRSSGRNPTEASEIARIRGKLNRGEDLSAGDKATWDKYTSSRGGSRRQRTAPPPTNNNSRFKIIRD